MISTIFIRFVLKIITKLVINPKIQQQNSFKSKMFYLSWT